MRYQKCLLSNNLQKILLVVAEIVRGGKKGEGSINSCIQCGQQGAYLAQPCNLTPDDAHLALLSKCALH